MDKKWIFALIGLVLLLALIIFIQVNFFRR
jgi:hypothetical protein